MADEQTQQTPLQIRDRLDLRTIAGGVRMFDLPTVEGWREFPVPEDVSIPTMAKLLLIERQIDEADADTLEAALNAAVAEVMRIVRIRTPDAPDPDMDEFGMHRILASLAWLAGDSSVASAVQVTLMDGATVEAAEKAVATAHAASGEEVPDPQGQNPGPLVSSERSSTPSSGSGEATGGDQNGGDTARGGRSDSTSETLTSV